MKVTFLRDEYNNLWLFYASDIKIRHSAAKSKAQNMAAKMGCFNTKTRESVIKELENDVYFCSGNL